MAVKRRKSSGKPGSKVTRRVTRGKNKGDTVSFGFGPSGKPFPKRVVKDVGPRSTLRDNPGVKFGAKKGKAKKKGARRK
jgi:hypothetical protein